MVRRPCILDSAAKLLIHLIVNVPKSPIISRLKGLDPSFKFCYKVRVLTGIKEGRYDGRLYQLDFKASETFLSPV